MEVHVKFYSFSCRSCSNSETHRCARFWIVLNAYLDFIVLCEKFLYILVYNLSSFDGTPKNRDLFLLAVLSHILWASCKNSVRRNNFVFPQLMVSMWRVIFPRIDFLCKVPRNSQGPKAIWGSGWRATKALFNYWFLSNSADIREPSI